MPLIAVLIVLFSIGTLLLYGLPAARTRLTEYGENRALARAVAAADAIEEAENLRAETGVAARTAGGEAFVVDRQGRVVARGGPDIVSSPPERLVRAAADGDRMSAKVGNRTAAAVPLIRDGVLEGGVVFVPEDSEVPLYQIISRSNVEAAGIASVIGVGLMLLVAALLSRRVERLTLGAHAIEEGDLSFRIEPGFDDELGRLAKTFNAMAVKLETSFARLEEKSATLDAILNNLVEGVLATDLRGNVMFVNSAARQMLGVGSQDDSKVLPNPWVEFDLPEAVARCARGRECSEASVRSGETFLRIRMEHLPEFDDHNGGVLVVIQDLSEGERLEANQQRFLANAAHELKTPITTILGASELLLTENEDDPGTRRRFLNHILAEARRMQRLSDTLLRLARTGLDLRDPELAPVDSNAAVRRVSARMEPLANRARVEVRPEGPGGRVLADEEWLEQALLVLANNAVQHCGEGGRVVLRATGGRITVEDDGNGIGEDDLPHVFERFYKGTGGHEGFGLGLPICKELVERMGGSISIRSEKGSGTSVKVELLEVDEGAEDTHSRR